MSTSLKFPRWIAAAMLFAAAPAFSQDGDRPGRDDRPDRDDKTVIREKETVRQRGDVQINRLSSVLKHKVVIQEDQPAGQIVDVVYNDGGCIDYFVADHDSQFYVIPFSAAVVRPADQVVFVDIAPARFREVHFFSGDSWPDLWAPTFQQQVFTTFGVSTTRSSRTTLRQGTDVDIDRRGRGRADVDVDVDRRGRGRADVDVDVDRGNRDRDDRPNRDGDDADRPNRDRDDADRPDRDSADRDADRPAPGRDADRPEADRGNTPRPPAAGTTPRQPAAGNTPPRREGNAPGQGTAPGKNPAPKNPAPPAGKKPEAPKDDPLKGAPEVEAPKAPAPKKP
jgi:hypothetical protein